MQAEHFASGIGTGHDDGTAEAAEGQRLQYAVAQQVNGIQEAADVRRRTFR